jgi:transposase
VGESQLSLSETERTEAQRFVRQGKTNARTLTRAWVLLKLADGWDEAKIAETFAISQATIKNIVQRFAEGGLDLVLHDRVQQRRRQALTGQQAAHLIALTYSPAPDGHDHWTVRLLAGKAVELGFVKSISPTTIHDLLKKTTSSPGSTNTGACHQWEGTL